MGRLSLVATLLVTVLFVASTAQAEESAPWDARPDWQL